MLWSLKLDEEAR